MSSYLDTLHRTPCDGTRYEPDDLAAKIHAAPGCMCCTEHHDLLHRGDCWGAEDPERAYQPDYGIGIDHGAELAGDMRREG